jgi:hypothetical protein
MRLLRSVVLSVGLGVLGLLGLTEWGLRRRYGVPTPPSAADGDEVTGGSSAEPPSRAVSRTRLALGAAGVAVAVDGLVVALRTVPWTSNLGIAIWLVGAIILHDAVLVPAVTVLRAGAHRAGHRLPEAALALVSGGFVVVGVLSLFALPEIWAQHLGPLNPSVLAGAYGQALAVTWLVVAVLTAAGIAVVVVHARRQPEQQIERSTDASRTEQAHRLA